MKNMFFLNLLCVTFLFVSKLECEYSWVSVSYLYVSERCRKNGGVEGWEEAREEVEGGEKKGRRYERR